MTLDAALQGVVFLVVLTALALPLGSYMARSTPEEQHPPYEIVDVASVSQPALSVQAHPAAEPSAPLRFFGRAAGNARAYHRGRER
ncbi:MAG: hypothetical protein IT373_33570 [Polyangiaceae bacterium]|nr:hypothetical protein [Polyangiaceae bacterium]